MRITIIVPQSLESPSVIMAALPIAMALEKHGCYVKLILLHHNISEMTKRSFSYSKGIDVVYVGEMFVKKVGDAKIYYSFFQLMKRVCASTLGLLKECMIDKADIIQVFKPHPPIVVASLLAQIVRRRPLVLMSDDYEAQSNELRSAFLKKIFEISERILARRAKAIIVMSKFLESHYRKITNPEKVFYIPPGITPERFERLLLTQDDIRTQLSLGDARVVLFFGSLHAKSGHRVDLLIKAFSKVTKHVQNVKLLLIGSGEINELKNLAKELHVEKDVVFSGRFPFEHLPSYVNSADIIVDPVDDSIVNKAKCSTRVRVGMLFGRPVITGDVGDRADMLGEAGIVVPPDDIQALAQALIDLLKDPDRAKSLGQKGKERIKCFYWDEIIKDYLKIYKSCCYANR